MHHLVRKSVRSLSFLGSSIRISLFEILSNLKRIETRNCVKFTCDLNRVVQKFESTKLKKYIKNSNKAKFHKHTQKLKDETKYRNL